MTMKKSFLLLAMLTALIFPSAHASVLSTAANALPARSFVKLATNSSLVALGLHESLFYWGDSAVWNPVANRIEWVGSEGNCCDDHLYLFLTYTEANNQWEKTVPPTNLFPQGGHSYDGNALDPMTGRHYFTYFNDQKVKMLSGGIWSELPNFPYSPVAVMALVWFPDINGVNGGLVHVGGTGRSSWFDGSKWTDIPKPSAAWGEYNVFAEYDPIDKVVWLGAGNATPSEPNGDRVSYMLDKNLKLTKRANAPFSLSNGAAIHACDPVSGHFVVHNYATGTWWDYNIQSDVWTQLTGLLNAPSWVVSPGTGNQQFQVPLKHLGVILLVDSGRDVYLYKHTNGGSVPTPLPARPRRLRTP